VTFILGGALTLDLATTLPSNVMKGGTFGIDPRGAALPAGMTLLSSGILSVGSARTSEAIGVIFTYSEP